MYIYDPRTANQDYQLSRGYLHTHYAAVSTGWSHTLLGRRCVLGVALAGFFAVTVPADERVTAAVASNFAPTFEKVRPFLPDLTSFVSGSTGKLFAQIGAGAPFDVFFSADERTPTQLVADGLAVAASLRVYARGVLVLWAAASDAKA
jgi:molybdate transport system substrate-binding protein